MCDVLETVWSEPGSPVDEHSPSSPQHTINTKKTSRSNNRVITNGNTAKSMKTKAIFAALDNMLSRNPNGYSPDGDPDELFLLPDRVLAADSLTFREELAAVAPAFLSPITPTTPSGMGFDGFSRTSNKSDGYSNTHLPHKSSSLDSNRSTDSSRSSVRLADDTEGLIITRACKGCLWLCKYYHTNAMNYL